jgi:hypothetical protein
MLQTHVIGNGAIDTAYYDSGAGDAFVLLHDVSRCHLLGHLMVRANDCGALLDGMRGREHSAAERRGIDHLGETEHWRHIEPKLEQTDPHAWVGLVGDMHGRQYEHADAWRDAIDHHLERIG